MSAMGIGYAGPFIYIFLPIEMLVPKHVCIIHPNLNRTKYALCYDIINFYIHSIPLPRRISNGPK